MIGKSVSNQFAPTAKVANTVKFTGCGNVILGEYSSVEDYVLFDTADLSGSQIVIGARTKIKQGAILRTYDGQIEIGERVSIGEYSVLAGHGGLFIEDAVIIAGHCYFTAADHICQGSIPSRFQGETVKGIRIGRGAWFGARCVILDGVEVAEGCVIGAGSVVTRNLSANMICTGTPCREVRPRLEANDVNW